MSPPHNFAFSQASLQDYSDCPRRFQLRYLLGVRWPADHDEPIAEWERLAQRGAAFHRLVHQHTIGISVDALSATIQDRELHRWWRAYLTAPPQGLPTASRRSEVRLSTQLGGHRLTARYDLLAIEPGERAVIVDWKTSEKRPRRAWLEKRWQTTVYRYVLVEAGTHLNGRVPLVPPQVELIYWFANYPAQVERFPYAVTQHATLAEALSATIGEIVGRDQETWALTEDLRRCRYCPYRTFCDREKAEEGEMVADEEGDFFDFDLNLEQIAEIEF